MVPQNHYRKLIKDTRVCLAPLTELNKNFEHVNIQDQEHNKVHKSRNTTKFTYTALK